MLVFVIARGLGEIAAYVSSIFLLMFSTQAQM